MNHSSWNTKVLIVCAFVFALIFGMLTGATLESGNASRFEYWFERYQTLIAGLLAIVAAFIAAYPVRKQLAKMNVQAAIDMRQHLDTRLKRTNQRYEKTLDLIGSLYLDEIAVAAKPNSKLPSHLTPKISSYKSFMNRMIEENIERLESDAVFKARVDLIDALETLIDSLSGETELSKEDVKKFSVHFAPKVRGANRGYTLLTATLNNESRQLRRRIFEIDDLILNEPLK